MSKLKSKILKFKFFRMFSNVLFVFGIVLFFFFSVSTHNSLITVGVIAATISITGLVLSEVFEYLIKQNIKIYKNIKFKKQNNPVTIIDFKKIA